jgi:hypothetical protein
VLACSLIKRLNVVEAVAPRQQPGYLAGVRRAAREIAIFPGVVIDPHHQRARPGRPTPSRKILLVTSLPPCWSRPNVEEGGRRQQGQMYLHIRGRAGQNWTLTARERITKRKPSC